MNFGEQPTGAPLAAIENPASEGLALNLTAITGLKHARCAFWDEYEAANNWPGAGER